MKSCKTCIHILGAHLRADGLCVPQIFSPTHGRPAYDNEPCCFYNEAPKERTTIGSFGIKKEEVWDSEIGDYVVFPN